MRHGILTGQVAPPPERFNLREDIAARVSAVRGLRDNPLATHLRLAQPGGIVAEGGGAAFMPHAVA